MNPRHVLAIARLTLRDASRSRLLPSVGFLLVLVITGLPFLITDSGAGTSRMFVLLRYSMSTVLFLLTITTLWASCGAVAGDIADRRIYLVLAKPVRRSDFWAGKWLGILSMNAALLAFAGLLVWGMLQLTLSRLPPDSPERVEAGTRLLTARLALKPDLPPEITDRITRRELALRRDPAAKGQEPREMARQQVIRGSMIVPPMGTLELHYSQVPVFTPSQRAELRCIIQSSRPEGGFLSGVWRIRSLSGETREIAFTNRPGVPTRILIPPFEKPSDSLLISLVRTDSGKAGHFMLAPRGEPPELLVPAGSFTPNLARALLSLLFRLCFVAAVGVTLGCLLSTPVSVFSGFALLIVLHMTGFVTRVVSTGAVLETHHGEVVAPEGLNRIVLHILQLLDSVTGPLAHLDPLPLLADGRMVSATFALQAFAILAVLFTLGAALPGMRLFTRRELP